MNGFQKKQAIYLVSKCGQDQTGNAEVEALEKKENQKRLVALMAVTKTHFQVTSHRLLFPPEQKEIF